MRTWFIQLGCTFSGWPDSEHIHPHHRLQCPCGPLTRVSLERQSMVSRVGPAAHRAEAILPVVLLGWLSSRPGLAMTQTCPLGPLARLGLGLNRPG